VLAFVTFGAAPAKRRVVPIVVRIGNSPLAKPEPPDRAPGELLSPPRALLASREARGALAAEALKSHLTAMPAEQCARFIEFRIPADSAVLPLGWQLSQAARRGLRQQFEQRPGVLGARRRRQRIRSVRRGARASRSAFQVRRRADAGA
jgi:hypothetical protein